MNVGIYGDSFADQRSFFTGTNNSLHWAELLGEKYTIKNYGEGGSSLLYSYYQFINNHKNYDFNIFVVTSPGRLWIDNQELMDTGVMGNGFFPGISSVEFSRLIMSKNRDLSWNKKRLVEQTLSSIESYYLIWRSYQQELLIHQAILNDISRMMANTLIIPAFPESFNRKEKFYSLTDISNMELSTKGFFDRFPDGWGTFISKTRMLADYRKGHFSPENHEILYKKIDQHIVSKTTGELQIDLDDFVVPSGPLESMLVLTDGANVFPYSP